MPTWGEIGAELAQSAPANNGVADYDGVRRKYLGALSGYTGRNTILYASRWTQGSVSDPSAVSIGPEDMQAFMEVVHGLSRTDGLDLILHSPGGSPEAAESIVNYLRSKFDSIRVIVPMSAMSAATMLSCAADEIIMGLHSSLGPIDPQMIMVGVGGVTTVAPAQAILDQFQLALEDCEDPKKLGAWLPILPQYGPALLVQCDEALDLAERLVADWLARWMLPSGPRSKRKATRIAKALADHGKFKSHGRPIHFDAAKRLGLRVTPLEADQLLQDLVLSVFHATTHVFSVSPVPAKIVENQLGRAFVKNQRVAFAPPILQVQPPATP